jgi:hypothetical protein
MRVSPTIAAPMMGRRGPFHCRHTPRKLARKAEKPVACELARHHDLTIRIDDANLKDPLRQIEPNARDRAQFPNRLAHGRRSSDGLHDNDHLGTLMPFGAPSTPLSKPCLPSLERM